MKLFISIDVRQKLTDKHCVTEKEILECFANRDGKDLFDTRPQHLTNPITRWFLALTNAGRLLKICYMFEPTTQVTEIKSAFGPNADEIRIYKKYGY